MTSRIPADDLTPKTNDASDGRVWRRHSTPIFYLPVLHSTVYAGYACMCVLSAIHLVRCTYRTYGITRMMRWDRRFFPQETVRLGRFWRCIHAAGILSIARNRRSVAMILVFADKNSTDQVQFLSFFRKVMFSTATNSWLWQTLHKYFYSWPNQG